MTDFAFRSKLCDFIQGADDRGIPIDRMFVSATIHSRSKTCRPLCVEFIECVVRSKARGESCTDYVFKQFVKGTRLPQKDLQTLYSI
jgi:hypothetical protein